MITKDVQLRLLITAVNRAGAQLEEVGSQLNEASQKAEVLSKKGKELGDVGARGATRFSAALAKLKTRMEGVKAVGDKMVGIGTQLSLIGAGMLAATAFPVLSAATFEKTMSGVLAVTTGAGEAFADLSKKALELGRTTKFTATQAAEGMIMLGRAGFDAREVIVGIEPALRLASAGNLELKESADIATNVLGGMRLEIEDLAHVADVLANTASSTNSIVQELGEAFSYVAADASRAGLSLEKTAAILGVFHDLGIKATRAGTALRAVILGLSAMTPRAEKAFAELNVVVAETVEGNIDIVQTMNDLISAGPSAQQMVRIFGRSWAGMAENVDVARDKIIMLTKANEDATGKARNMAKIMIDNLVGAFTLLTSAADGFANAIGRPLLKPLTEIIRAVTKVVSAMAEWAEENPAVASSLTAIVGGLGGLLLAIGAVLVPFGLFVQLIAVAIGGLGTFVTVLTVTVAALRGFAAATWLAITAGTALSSMFLALGAAWGVWQIAGAIKQLIDYRREAGSAEEATRELAAAGKTLVEGFQAWADWTPPEDITGKTKEELAELEKEVDKALRYVLGLRQELSAKALGRTWLGNITSDAQEALKTLDEVKKREAVLWASWDKFRQVRAEVVKLPEVEEEDPAITKAREDALRKTEELRISLMADTIKKLEVLRELEVSDFKLSEERKVLSVIAANERIALINKKYNERIAEERERLLEKSIQVERTIRAKELQISRVGHAAELIELEDSYRRGNVSIESYLAKRRALKLKHYDEEIAEIKRKIEEELDPDKTRVIEFELKLKEAGKAAAEISIDVKDTADYDEQLANEQAFQQELAMMKKMGLDSSDMKAHFEAEQEFILTQNEWRLEELRKQGIAETEIRELAVAQEIAAAERVAEHERQVLQMRYRAALDIASGLESVFADLYTTSNEQVKAFFYIQKAIAFAEALISAFAGSAKVLDSPLMKIDPTAAMALSKVVLAAGMARAASILAVALTAAEGGYVKIAKFARGGAVKAKSFVGQVQTFAEGGQARGGADAGGIGDVYRGVALTTLPTMAPSGLVKGPKGKDVIPAWLTDEEYVMNPKAVQKYGLGFMEAVNRGLLKLKDVMFPAAGLSRTAVMVQKGVPLRLAEGGATSSMMPVTSIPSDRNYSVNVPVNITPDDPMLAARLRDSIEDTVLRVLREEMAYG